MVIKTLKFLLCVVCAFAWSCTCPPENVHKESRYGILYVNDSSHRVTIIWSDDGHTVTEIARGDNQKGFMGTAKVLLQNYFPELPPYILRFDDNVTYDSRNDSASEYGHLLSSGDSYEFICIEQWGEHYSGGVYVYTFTDADYEYAVEHGVEYDPE